MKTVKCRFYEDEMYPVYYLATPEGYANITKLPEIEIPEDVYDEFLASWQLFRDYQKYIKDQINIQCKS